MPMQSSKPWSQLGLCIGTLALLLAVVGWTFHSKELRYGCGKHFHSSSAAPAMLVSETERNAEFEVVAASTAAPATHSLTNASSTTSGSGVASCRAEGRFVSRVWGTFFECGAFE